MNNLTPIFSEHLVPLGFEYKKGSWYRVYPEIHQVINLQKSDYGEQYYTNIGVSPSELCPTKYMPAHKFHLRLRSEDVTLDPDLAKKMFDLKDLSLTESDRIEQIKKALTMCVTFLDRVKDINSLRTAISSNSKLLNRTVLDLRTLIGL